MHRGLKCFLCHFVLFFVAACLAKGATPIAGPVTNSTHGHIYYLLSADTWANAEAAAVRLGGHLVTIDGAAESDWVFRTFWLWGGIPRTMWIGLNDAAQEGVFVWVSGAPYPYRNWSPDQPDNLGGNEHYAAYDPPGAVPSTWHDANGTNLFHGVVELTAHPKTSLTITASPVRLTMSVIPGNAYLLQSSADMRTWEAVGSAFVADTPLMQRGVGVLTARRFFRLENLSMTARLAAEYRLNGDANDSSGNNNHGYLNAASVTTNRFGLVHRALQFDGTNSFVMIPESDAFDTKDYTVSLWFRADQLPSPFDAAFLFSKGRNNFELHLGSASSGATGIRFLPRLAALSQPFWDTAAGSYQTNTWHHIVAIFQPSANIIRMFVDGQPVTLSGSPTVASAPDNTADARIGMRSDGNYPFKGAIDSVRIYSRGLSDTEVLTLFHHPDE